MNFSALNTHPLGVIVSAEAHDGAGSFTATANVKTQVYVIPEQYLRDILNKADPFVKHGFRTWFKLTNKFLVALDKSLEKDTKQKKQDEADKESYNKMKSVS